MNSPSRGDGTAPRLDSALVGNPVTFCYFYIIICAHWRRLRNQHFVESFIGHTTLRPTIIVLKHFINLWCFSLPSCLYIAMINKIFILRLDAEQQTGSFAPQYTVPPFCSTTSLLALMLPSTLPETMRQISFVLALAMLVTKFRATIAIAIWWGRHHRLVLSLNDRANPPHLCKNHPPTSPVWPHVDTNLLAPTTHTFTHFAKIWSLTADTSRGGLIAWTRAVGCAGEIYKVQKGLGICLFAVLTLQVSVYLFCVYSVMLTMKFVYEITKTFTMSFGCLWSPLYWSRDSDGWRSIKRHNSLSYIYPSISICYLSY